MRGEVTLQSALEQIQGSAVKDGLANLRHVLRHNQHSSNVEVLGDASFHKIYEVLFNVAVAEQSTWLKAKTPTTKSAAENRLSACAGALRLAVEVGVQNVKLKTVKALLDHIIGTLLLSNGGLCTPLALDYAKSIRALLNYQPHVEHLPKDIWENAALFCIQTIKTAETEAADDGEFASTNMNVSSYMSSRSHMKDSVGSQGIRSLAKQVAEEMVATLCLLTNAPNAAVPNQASDILWSLINFLRGSIAVGRSHQDGFAAINNILSWIRTENIMLTQKATSQLIRLIKELWTLKSSTLKDEMLSTLLYLKPFILRSVQQEENIVLRKEANDLLSVMETEYSKRQERDQMHLEELRLARDSITDHRDGFIGTSIFSLHNAGAGSEQNWAIVSTLATLYDIRLGAANEVNDSDNDEDRGSEGPRKRQRLADDFKDLLTLSNVGTPSSRACALQTITFLAQTRSFTVKRLFETINELSQSCNEDVSTVASWAFVALASCASQVDSINPALSAKWSEVWQLASRAITNSPTCRAACFLLGLMQQLRLVPQSSIVELGQTFTTSMEVAGPCVLADSVSHLLVLAVNDSQQLNPAATSALAESILGRYLLKKFVPSKFEDKIYAANCNVYESVDITSIANACLNRDTRPPFQYKAWSSVGQTWLACRAQEDLVAYLLLLPKEETIVNQRLQKSQTKPPASDSTAPSRPNCELLVLDNFTSELQSSIDNWKRCSIEHSRALSFDMFKSVCMACAAICSIAHGATFRDARRSSQVQKQAEDFLRDLSKFVSNPACDEAKADAFVSIFSQAFAGLAPSSGHTTEFPSPAEVMVCQAVSKAITARRRATDFNGHDDDDMDLDDNFDSQDSRQGKSSNKLLVLKNDSAVACTTTSLRESAVLYAKTISVLHGSPEVDSSQETQSAQVVDYVLSLSETSILSTRAVLSMLAEYGLHLSPADAERLLEYLTEEILQAYAYERSEVATGAILEILSSLLSAVTDRNNKSLYDLGLDMYDWFTAVALTGGVLSPNVQRRVARLLLQISHVDADYGTESDVSSVRTSLFKLLKHGNVSVLFHMADQISSIFGLFVLSNHEKMFEDLKESLPDDVDWIEGMAMRLLFLANIASAWHSLLRQCTYYIFETAGQVKSTVAYAKNCVGQLIKSLRFSTAQKLFRLFAPQLVYTWLDIGTLSSLPYEIFQYESLKGLLDDNLIEISAQLIMRGSEDSMHAMCTTLNKTEKELSRQSFARALAYTISWDIGTPKSEANAVTSEARLRNMVGTKDDFRRLIAEHFPTVVGQFYLSMQHDDNQDKWLAKRPQYASAAKSLDETKNFSHSARSLPPSHQPSFKSKYLCDQIEKLCRRTSNDPVKPWNPSSFSLAARMLLDSLDNALGPLHTCHTLRKLRVLICMAGDVAVSGFALEMLIHSIRPFLTDSECADDALGILQYLLKHGQPYLTTNNLPFAYGTITLMILQMRQHALGPQNSTTQESQHQLTVQRMQNFQAWLVDYLKKCKSSADVQNLETYNSLAKALASVELPGNAVKDTPESSLMLLLLKQIHSTQALLGKSDCMDALSLLSKDFVAPDSISDDCLGSDVSSLEYSDVLWGVLQASNLDQSFLLWAAGAVGRAYASTGKRPESQQSEDRSSVAKSTATSEGAAKSQSLVAKRLSDLVMSNNQTESGLADYTLRKSLITLKDAEEALRFEHMLPDQLVSAIADGTCGYEPAVARETISSSVDQVQLRQALKMSPELSDDDWTTTLAVTLCLWASNTSILPVLPAIISNVEGLAVDILAPMIHMVLVEERDSNAVLRKELSKAMSEHFETTDDLIQNRQRFFLRLLLYLRGQALPGEATNADRLRWLDVDFLLAAKTAARCNMPTTALLVAESATQPAQTANRRTSSRASMSMSQVEAATIPDELLLSIFRQIEEPDSFYGVQQPASLDNVLGRLDYEENGLKSLMFRSAQMDSLMRASHRQDPSHTMGMVHSLSVLNLNSLTFALLSGSMATATGYTDEMLHTAQSLQQWDLMAPQSTSGASATSFNVFQELSRSTGQPQFKEKLRSVLSRHVDLETGKSDSHMPSYSWCNTLASLTEINEVVDITSEDRLTVSWHKMLSRQDWMQNSPYEDSGAMITNRQTLFSVLAQNKSLLKDMHVSPRFCKKLEAESLLKVSQYARSHGVLQEALSATTQFSLLANLGTDMGLALDAAAKIETASVLWDTGEATTSVMMLRDVLDVKDVEAQDIAVGRSGLLSQLAHQLAEARLEKPDDILENYLKPAIKHLRGRNSGHEAGNVFHEFASFCDQQLQSPGNIEDFNRIAKLRQKKSEEVEALENLNKTSKKTGDDKRSLDRSIRQAKQWLEIDDVEYTRLKNSRDTFVQQSLQNYMLALHASDEHDICVLRFFALWLENAEVDDANKVVSKHLTAVPSWKFVVLLNQLMSRLENDTSTFQASLKSLATRLCSEHPYHSLHHLYSSTRKPSKDGTAYSRYEAATAIRGTLTADGKKGELLKRVFYANGHYNFLAQSDIPSGARSKMSIKDFPAASKMASKIPDLQIPPATVTLQLQPDGNYSDVPVIHSFSSTVSIMTGLSKPKSLTAYASNGKPYKQLFKGGNDDLRQDAIMEQVFEEVSKMLRNHKTTRKRNLQVRTYKVIPLSPHSGIMEFVANSIPINDFLEPAHLRYHPEDMKPHMARQKLAAAKDPEARVKEYQKICQKLHPIMRHFFFERFHDPDEWFEKRTAYTRTTAAISILGHILGLGDRHCHNILLDEKSGEVVHIDLGVAFEAGRILPVPELVPFRLTRDIVDGMGATKTEGIFRRCCEFTMDALREDKDGIMTLLNVLRYDPLYTWTVSPLKAKRMQHAQETGRNGNGGGVEVESSKKKDKEAGEADRALSIVEKKLSKTLSTAAAVNELIQQATDERNLGTLFQGWSAYL